MRKHSPAQKKQNLTAQERIQKKLAELRAQIKQNRKAAARAGKGTKVRRPGEPELNFSYNKIRAEPYEVVIFQFAELLFADKGTINEKTLALGNSFLETVSWGHDRNVKVFIEEGFPVTYQDPHTGSTALHKAAASQARDAIRVLLKTGECDFLIRDNKGRLASEMAYLYGHDPALARLLGNKERKQAEAQGIKLTRRPAKPQR